MSKWFFYLDVSISWYCWNGELLLKNNIEKKKLKNSFEISTLWKIIRDRVLNYSFIRKFQSFEMIVLVKYKKKRKIIIKKIKKKFTKK